MSFKYKHLVRSSPAIDKDDCIIKQQLDNIVANINKKIANLDDIFF